jgi:hypothetical protein
LHRGELQKANALKSRRFLGSFGFAAAGFVRRRSPLGSFGSTRRWSARPASTDAIWEFYPISADVTTAIYLVRMLSDFTVAASEQTS